MRAFIPLIVLLASAVGSACWDSEPVDEFQDENQRAVVEDFANRTAFLQVACLDVNGDGLVDGNDADPNALPDITGDGVADEADLGVLSNVSLVLPGGRPESCPEGEVPDWQVTAPAEVDCAAGDAGLIVLAVGGGGGNLADPSFGAGMRWMLVGIGEALEGEGVVHQLASVTPGLNGTEQPQLDAEAWAAAYLTAELSRSPCLQVVMFGHSFGGMLVKAVAAQLEAAGLGEQIMLTALVDPFAGLYNGTVDAMPQTSPVLNVFQTNDESFPHWPPIDQPNVENWDASGERGPEDGDAGGRSIPVIHTNIDNSEGVRDRIKEQVVERSCDEGLC